MFGAALDCGPRVEFFFSSQISFLFFSRNLRLFGLIVVLSTPNVFVFLALSGEGREMAMLCFVFPFFTTGETVACFSDRRIFFAQSTSLLLHCTNRSFVDRTRYGLVQQGN